VAVKGRALPSPESGLSASRWAMAPESKTSKQTKADNEEIDKAVVEGPFTCPETGLAASRWARAPAVHPTTVGSLPHDKTSLAASR
jgi:hypothetical protein